MPSFELLREAMDLFNRLKPEFSLFKDKVVRFQFTSWDGQFTYDSWPLDEFIAETSDELFYLKKLKGRFEKICAWLVITVGFSVVGITTWSLLKLVPQSPLLLQNVISLLAAFVSGYLLHQLLHWRLPRRIFDDGRLKDISSRVQALRQRLQEIRGSRPDPFQQQREQRLGQLILNELSETLSAKEIERLLRRLRSHLFVVPPEKGGTE